MKLKYLMPGVESSESVSLLICLTQLDSEEIIDGIYAHLVSGMSITGAALINGIPKQNLSRALTTLNDVAEIVYRHKYVNRKAYNQSSDDKAAQ